MPFPLQEKEEKCFLDHLVKKRKFWQQGFIPALPSTLHYNLVEEKTAIWKHYKSKMPPV